MRRIVYKKFFAIALLTYFLLCTLWAHAAEYALNSDYRLSGRFNDNYRLVIDPQAEFDELSGADFSADYTFARNTEISSLSATLDLDAGAYNIDAYNTFDQRATGNYRRAYERGSWNIGASVNNDSVRVTEATEAGSGRFAQTDERSKSIGLNAGWSSQLTERHSLQWSAFGTDQRYDSSAFTDYEYGGASVLWQYVLNERFRLQSQLGYNVLNSGDDNVVFNPLIFDANASGIAPGFVGLVIAECQEDSSFLSPTLECFKNQKLDNEQTTLSTQVGIYYLISERLVLDILVGRTAVDTDSLRTYTNRSAGATDNVPPQAIKRKNDNTTYTAELSYDAENLEYTFSATSRDSATSSGVLTNNTQLAFDTSWQMNELSTLLFRFSWFDQQTSAEEDLTFNDREMYSGLVRYSRRLNEHWTVSTSYRYYDQRRSAVDEHANSNEAFLTLRWRPTTLKWSQ